MYVRSADMRKPAENQSPTAAKKDVVTFAVLGKQTCAHALSCKEKFRPKRQPPHSSESVEREINVSESLSMLGLTRAQGLFHCYVFRLQLVRLV